MTLGRLARRILISPVSGLHARYSNRHLPADLEALRHDVPARIAIPWRLGLGQAVHPDILDPDGDPRPFVLTLTPYPFAEGREENPCVLVSDDGLRFREEVRGINPLVPPPPFDHNDDPDLVYHDGTYYIFYLETLRPGTQNLRVIRSTDRRAWTSETIATYHLAGSPPDPFIVSPSVALLDGTFYLFYVNTSVHPYRIEYLRSDRIDSWDIGAGQVASLPRLAFIPWHVDVCAAEGAFYMLASDVQDRPRGRRGFRLHLMRSTDLERWTEPAPVFSEMPFHCRGVYRSTAIKRGSDLYVFFSYESRVREWKIAVVRKRLADILKGRPA